MGVGNDWAEGGLAAISSQVCLLNATAVGRPLHRMRFKPHPCAGTSMCACTCPPPHWCRRRRARLGAAVLAPLPATSPLGPLPSTLVSGAALTRGCKPHFCIVFVHPHYCTQPAAMTRVPAVHLSPPPLLLPGCYLPITAALGGLLFLRPAGYREASRDVVRLSPDINHLLSQQVGPHGVVGSWVHVDGYLPSGCWARQAHWCSLLIKRMDGFLSGSITANSPSHRRGTSPVSRTGRGLRRGTCMWRCRPRPPRCA